MTAPSSAVAERLEDLTAKLEADLSQAAIWLPACSDARSVARRLGVTTRYLRRVVAAARVAGVPVVSGDFGYRMPSSPEDAEACAQRLRAHAKEELLAASRLERWAQRKRETTRHDPLMFATRDLSASADAAWAWATKREGARDHVRA